MRVLDHHHGVGALGHRRAGHDLRALSRADHAGKRSARANLAYDLERRSRRSEISGAHREAVARRAIKRRIVAIGSDGPRQNASQRIAQWNSFNELN
jgi:hypothetical protein